MRGALVDVETLQPLAEVAVGGRTFTDGAAVDFVDPFSLEADGDVPTSALDGSFALEFTDFGGICDIPGAFQADFLLRTDQIEIIVVRSGCEQTFLIDINEDTAVIDVDSPNGVIELKDPILVGPCEE